MSADDDPALTENARLRRRLERERAARRAAETIAEEGLRELYERQLELQLMEEIAVAANEANEVSEIVRYALRAICAYVHCPLGHAQFVTPGSEPILASGSIWHYVDGRSFDTFRDAAEEIRIFDGIGVAPRVLETASCIFVQDLEDGSSLPGAQEAVRAGFRSVFGFPARVGPNVAVVLQFFSEQPFEAPETLQRVLNHIGTQLGRTVERERARARLLHDAFHDSLTGLPNRALFLERLGFAIGCSGRRKKHSFAVLFLDLDRFKVVNDSLGHHVGDQLIIEVSRRLKTCLRQTDVLVRGFGSGGPVSVGGMDIVARMGGDEFTVLLDGIHGVNDAIHIAERIEESLRIPFHLYGREVFTTASIGIAIREGDGEAAADVLRDADIAMYRAKARGGGCWELFDTTVRTRIAEGLDLELDLHRAVESAEFRLHFQPIVAVPSGAPRGYEALVRWQHPSRGLVAPIDFIGLAEETGLIASIGSWVLREACRLAKRLHDEFGADPIPFVSVNVSALQLARSDFLESVSKILTETGCPPQSLKLELTESVAMSDAERTLALLHSIRRLGVRLCLDDFGTGYSSLSYLSRLPVDTVKIDRSFVSGVDSDDRKRHIVGAIVTLAERFGMEVIAEGAETLSEIRLLTELKCPLAQGFYFATPTDAETIVARLRANALEQTHLAG